MKHITILCAFLGAFPSHGRAAESPVKPNIIFLLADDLGSGDLGCFGQARIKTPHLDRLATEGIRFTQTYSGSTVGAPSRCVLMTGRHTARVDWTDWPARQGERRQPATKL